MSKSSDPGHFFQTETSLATAARRAVKAKNKSGKPIQCTSKILSVLPDPLSPTCVYVAESCGIVRRIDLETESNSHTYRGHTVPTTCLALSGDGKTLFGGSWDKTITAWDVESREIKQTFKGHTDFIKSLLYIPCAPGSRYAPGILLSGSSDKDTIIWNTVTGGRLHVLKGHNRAVGTMAVDPIASTLENAVVYTAGSERDIRQWNISLTSITSSLEGGDPIVEHDTSVFSIGFYGEDYDFWSASADFTARRIDVRAAKKKNGERSDMVLKHPDYVNDVLVAGKWIITACRDEDVRVWDAGSGELYHTFSGHADEVSGLTLVGENGDILVSVSIDCTVRQWSLKPADLQTAKQIAESGRSETNEQKNSILTEEEERELAELMEDSD